MGDANKTLEMVDGIPHFFLVIPCSPGKREDRELLSITAPCKCGRKECIAVRYQCQECNHMFRTLRAWRRHKGIGVMVSQIACKAEK